MELTVLAVGDGACSTIRSASSGPLMVVDCGTAGNGGISAAATLAFHLGSRAQSIDTVVVTHFDADHWAGLKALPLLWGQNKPARAVIFRYPALLPGAAGANQMAFLALQAMRIGGPISSALDLFEAWKAEGVSVLKAPTVRADSFMGGGQSWMAHWPPIDDSSFYARTKRAIEDSGRKVRALAQDVPEFADALRDVQGTWFGNDNNRDAVPTGVTSADLEAALRDALGDGIDDFITQVTKFTNMLSLVHTGTSVANFGDCEGAGLGALMRLDKTEGPTFARSYPVVLTPHHGTHVPSQRAQAQFPSATTAVVSQNGKTRYDAGQLGAQSAFKANVANGVAEIVDTYDPLLAPSVNGPHRKFLVP